MKMRANIYIASPDAIRVAVNWNIRNTTKFGIL